VTLKVVLSICYITNDIFLFHEYTGLYIGIYADYMPMGITILSQWF